MGSRKQNCSRILTLFEGLHNACYIGFSSHWSCISVLQQVLDENVEKHMVGYSMAVKGTME